jgi:hypothetical protein
MPQKIQPRELFDSFAEVLLAERSVRPLVIVGTAKVADLLLEILRAFLLPQIKREQEQDEMLEGDSPLATFSARIKMCRRLGLLDETLYLALERLRLLRNLSAHSLSFDTAASPAREHLSIFRANITSRGSYQLTKKRYFDSRSLHTTEECQCMLLTLCVLLEAVLQKITPTAGNKRTLKIAAR